MINFTLLRKEFKTNRTVYLSLGISVMMINAMIMMIAVLINGKDEINSIGLILSNFLAYGPLFSIPTLLICTLSNRIVISEINSGSLTYVASSPVSRTSIIFTKLMFEIFVITFIVIVDYIITIACNSLTDKMYRVYSNGVVTSMYLGHLLLLYAIIGITFCASAWASTPVISWIIGGGLLLLFFIFSITASLSEFEKSLENFKYLTIITLLTDGYQQMSKINIIPSGQTLSFKMNAVGAIEYLVLLGIACGTMYFGIHSFKTRDLLL